MARDMCPCMGGASCAASEPEPIETPPDRICADCARWRIPCDGGCDAHPFTD